jgi:TP901 family phage tail tape measure protein
VSEVNANINIGIDSSNAIASLRSLQNQISNFNQSVISSNAAAVASQKSLNATLIAQVGATRQFSTNITNVQTSVSRLGNAIDKNKLSLGEYFRYAGASSKTFGKMFGREHNEVMLLAQDRVKRLQTQYIALGAAQNGMQRSLALRPLNLFNADAAIGIQRQQLFNKLLHDGSTSLVNFGKNTQWAGRQLMVGFTVPLTIFGGIAGQIFMDLERQVVNFRRVYGDATTPPLETDKMIEQIKELAKEFTIYGIAVKDTVALAADIAATGAQGEDLISATAESTRLATLGMIEMDQAMNATISLQTAFKLSNEELAEAVNFLNAVENQTVLSLNDVTVAIPKVAPIIKGLGGDVQDLAYFLTAMREGGVNAAEGANALKSGLASLINPTKGAREQLEGVGIDIDSIISKNKGNIRATVEEFGAALSTLGKFERQQTLAKVFGKYQFARLGALFANISTEGSQAQRVIDLTNSSVSDLAATADKELSAIEESVGMKFTGAMERLKLAIAPIGEAFLRIATPIIEFATKMLDKFNELSPAAKNISIILVAGLGVVVPTVTMLIGLFANFIGQAIKGISIFTNFFAKIKGGGNAFAYLAEEQLDANAAAASLEGRVDTLTSSLNVQRTAVQNLARAYSGYVTKATLAATNLPQGFSRKPRGMAAGGFVGGSGNKDSEPAMLMPGEFVVNKEASQKYGSVLAAMNEGTLKGYAKGSSGDQFAHIGSKMSMGAQSLEKFMDSLPDAFSITAKKLVKSVASIFGDTVKAIILPSLGFMTSGNINRRLEKPGKKPVRKKEFLEDWDKRGLARWSESLRRSGLKLNDVGEELEMFDSAMRGRISSLNENTTIDDKMMKEIYDQSRKVLPAQSKLITSFDQLSNTYKEVRVNLNQSNLASKGIETFPMGTKQGAVVGGKAIRVGGDRANYTQAALGATTTQLSQAGAAGVSVGNALDTGARGAIGAASPAKDGSRLVNDYVEGMKVGAQQNVAEVRQSGLVIKSAFIGAASGGATAAGAAGASSAIPLMLPLGKNGKPQPPEFPGPAGERSDLETKKIIPSDLGEGLDSADEKTNKLSKSTGRLGGRLSAVSLAMTAVAGGASMMGGGVGETAQKMLPLLLGLDALMMILPLISGAGGGAGLAGMGAGLAGVGGAAASAAGPILLIAAAVALVVAATVTAFKRSEQLREAFSGIADAGKELLETVVGPLGGAFENLGSIGEKVGSFFAMYFNKYVGALAVWLNIVAKSIEVVVKLMTMYVGIVKMAIAWVVENLPKMASSILDNIGPIGTVLRAVGGAISSFFTSIPGFVSNVFSNALDLLSTFVNGAIGLVNKLIDAYNVLPGDGIDRLSEVDFGKTFGQASTPPTSTPPPPVLIEESKPRDQATEEEEEEEEEEDSGGAEKEKTFLQKLIEDLNANAKLYLDAEKGLKGYEKNRGKFFGIFQKLRVKGVSEDIIASLGTGPEAIKNARGLLAKSKTEIQKLMKDVAKVSVGQSIEDLRRKRIEERNKASAARKTQGLDADLREIIMSDQVLTTAFATVKKGTPEYKALLKEVKLLAAAKKDLAAATETEQEAQEKATDAVLTALEIQINKIQNDLYNAFEKTYGKAPELIQLEIDQRNFAITQIQKQIDALENLNSADQARVDAIERQKEMISRQIEQIEKLNSLDQERIDIIRREDEIRNRTSSELSKELETMSTRENQITEAYDKRISALEKVDSINQRIVERQQQQLGLSQALSTGDIYQATAAAREMQASSAEFASEQARSGLEQGRQNSIDSLRTSGGLTREQAEQQINNIKEQSYQTSLLIRNIEDAIYNRNLQTIPLKNQQYTLDLQIRDINDLIYSRGVDIKKIQEEQIVPLTTQNDLQQSILDKLNHEVNQETGPLKAKYDATKRQEELNEKIRTQTENITTWSGRAATKADELATAWGSVASQAWEAAKAVAAATSSGSPQNKFAGGMIKGYAAGGFLKYTSSEPPPGMMAGGITGNGSRDSIPAMLTPGEFVIRKSMVDKYGIPMLSSLNQGSFSMPSYRTGETSKGNVSVKSNNSTNISAPMYNSYSVGVNVSNAGASADEIANITIAKIKQMQGTQIRSGRGY